MPSSASATGWRPRRRSRAAEPVEAGFWDAVEQGDLARARQPSSASTPRPLANVLPALSTWRARGRERSQIDGWRYRVTWKPVADPGPAADSRAPGCCSARAARSGEGAAALTEALTSHGATVLRLETGARTELADRLRTLDTPITGVLAPAGPLTGTLAVVQALGDADVVAPLWLLTRGAVATGPADPAAHPIQAEVWGFGRVVGLEHPDRWGGLIDLPEQLDPRAAARLVAVLAGSLGDETEVAVRGAGLLARRLTPAPSAPGAVGNREGRSWSPAAPVASVGRSPDGPRSTVPAGSCSSAGEGSRRTASVI